MNAFQSMIRRGSAIVLPGVHDALSARVAEEVGFQGLCIGGAATGIMQFALPDIGLQSFGEYRDCVARTCEGSALPVMLDAENGFGDAKAVARTVRTFERMGVAALILEDLKPLVGGEAPEIVSLAEMSAKLEAALRARASGDTWIVGRTDAAHAGRYDDVGVRAQRFRDIGVDAILATGLRDLDDMKRLRDCVDVPLIALVVETKPWVVPSPCEIDSLGYEIVVHAATLMLQVVEATRLALTGLRAGRYPAPAPSVDLAHLGALLKAGEWKDIDLAATQDHRST